MAIPHLSITRIPDNADAVPELWNSRYQEIDENFENLDSRTSSIGNELQAARGKEPSLDARLDVIEQNVEGLDPDIQNMILASIQKALSSAGLANREIEKTLQVRIQKGEIFIPNRGVISGLNVTKSTTATRNLNVSSGKFFMFGRQCLIKDMENTASVPSNNTDVPAISYAYLWIDEDNNIRIDCTQLNEDIPEWGLPLAQLDVPANNNESTDPYLNDVQITDIRRIEPYWPTLLQSAASKYISLQYPLSEKDYSLRLEILDYKGPKPSEDALIVESRAGNGFNVVVSCVADSLKVNYLVIQNTT